MYTVATAYIVRMPRIEEAIYACFNEVRDYTASDGALKALVTALKNLLRPTDFLGRWGGDEFVILTPQQESAACQPCFLACPL